MLVRQDLVAYVLLSVGFLILLHQALRWGTWFELRQFWHHENVAAVLFAFAGGILFTLTTRRRTVR